VKFNAVFLDDSFNISRRIFAKTAFWKGNNEITLSEGFTRAFKGNEPLEFNKFQEKTIRIKGGKEMFTKKIVFSQFMNIRELQQYIEHLRKSNSSTRKFEAKLHYKYAFPFSSFIMVLIAIPFSFLMGNRGSLYGIGIAVCISMIFWGAIGIFSSLGSIGILTPFLSAFSPVFIFTAVSIYLSTNVKT